MANISLHSVPELYSIYVWSIWFVYDSIVHGDVGGKIFYWYICQVTVISALIISRSLRCFNCTQLVTEKNYRNRAAWQHQLILYSKYCRQKKFGNWFSKLATTQKLIWKMHWCKVFICNSAMKQLKLRRMDSFALTSYYIQCF